MTRFRCAIVDETGVAGTRVIHARGRDQAMLLLLAEGVTPSSIIRDAPSLAERVGLVAPEDVANTLLQDLARLVACGFTIAGAAVAIDAEPDSRVATGTPVGEIMAGTPGLPSWIGAALILVAGHENEPGALIQTADDATTIGLRARALRSAGIEAGLMAVATTALIAVVIGVDVVTGLALCLAIYLALRNPLDAFRQSMRSLRQADFLLIVGRLLIAGAALRDSIRIAANDLLPNHDKALINATLAAQTNDADLRTDMGRRLGLSAANRAIIAHGDAAQAARAVSVNLAQSSLPALSGLSTVLRMSFVVVTTIALIRLISQ